jgi:hypothetical protein
MKVPKKRKSSLTFARLAQKYEFPSSIDFKERLRI